MRIIGVDFSGARDDNHVGNTWLAQGRLEGNTLTLEKPCPISRMALTNELVGLDEPAVVAMDFPFSVPREFANFWQPEVRNMIHLWDAAYAFEVNDFIALRKSFVDKRKKSGEKVVEPKRPCDPPESKSPLHVGNPQLVRMTFHGMRLLHRLWNYPATTNVILVPPLPEPPQRGAGHHTILLEVMPGAVLRARDLPFDGYKNGRKPLKALKLRQQILRELPQKVAPVRVTLSHLGDICLAYPDGLDAVVAAIAAALWCVDQESFRQPGHNPFLEGWLYTPRGWYPQ